MSRTALHARRSIARLLIAAMTLLSSPIFGNAYVSSEQAAASETAFDFERFESAGLNGQQGWTADAEVTVNEEDAASGTKSVKVEDDQTTKLVGMAYSFPSQTEGRVEWQAKPVTRSGLITQLQSAGTRTKTAVWFGFSREGTFVYQDGQQRVYTAERFKLDTWYRFHIAFDTVNDVYDLLVYGEDGLLLTVNGIAFMDTGITSINRLRMSTFTNEKATFYVDDVVIRNQAAYDVTRIDSIRLLPDTISLTEGESRPLQVVGAYRDGGLFRLTDEAAYMSDQPSVAETVYGAVYGIRSGYTDIRADWGGLSDKAKVYVYGAGDVPAHVPLDPRPLARETGLGELRIIVPADPPWRDAGTRIARLIESRWGIQASVETSETFVQDPGWPGNVLVIGNLENNPHMARLYGLRQTFADAVFPGPGGYQLQTLVDPFGQGGNTVVVAAGDTEGLAAAESRLDRALQAAVEPALPWLFEAAVADSVWGKLPLARKPAEADLPAGLAEADTLLAKLSTDPEQYAPTLDLLGKAARYGEAYQMTADPYYGAVYKKLVKGYADFINRNPETAKAQLNAPANMWGNGVSFISTWRVLEADPMFTGLERRQIASAAYVAFEANNLNFYLNRDYAAVGAKYNHDVFPALSIWFGASYFRDYFDFAAAEDWFRKGELMFRNNTANINLDEGSDYLMHVPAVSLDYAMASGNDRFLREGLRASADLNALMIDNLGTMAGGGDVYPFGRSSAYTWGHSNVMHAASWFYGDPLYDFLMRRTRTGPFTGQNMSDLDYPFHRYMTSKLDTASLDESLYPQVRSYPVEPAVYDELQAKTPDVPLEVAQTDTFHKLAMREGFDPDDAYLVLDGFSAGTHGHEDGNTIIKYSDNGRIFIDDRDYIERGPSHHTGVTVVKDGVLEHKPPFAKLEWGADAGGFGISRSTVPNYNGTDWERQIVSPGGRFFLIVDKLTFKESGSYSLENTWQTIGEPRLSNDRFEAAQQGMTMTIQSLDESALSQYDRYAHFIKYFKTIYPYPYADKETVLRQSVVAKDAAAGESRTFVNVLSSAPDGTDEVRAERLSGNAAAVREADGREWIALWSPVETETFRSNGKTHLIGEREWVSAEATSIRVGQTELSFAEPVIWKLDLDTGVWNAYGLKNAIPRYDDQGNPVHEGALQSGTVELGGPAGKKLMSVLAKMLKSGAPVLAKPEPGHPDAYRDWIRFAQLSGEAATAVSGDLNGDGSEELVIGGTNGVVEAFGEDGAKLWTFQGKGRINEVTVQKASGVPYVFAATEDFTLHALAADGSELWSYTFPDDAAHREMKGNLIGLTNVRLAYVNGKEQPPWVMVATQFRYLYGLTLSGELVYEDMPQHYGIQDMEFLDTDGDGRDEGILAMEYTSMVVWNEQRLGRGLGSQGPGWTSVTAVDGWSANAFPAVALGTKQNQVHLIQYKSGLAELWRRNAGGEVHDIWAGDANGDGRAEIVSGSEGHQVYSFGEDGAVRWRADVGDRVLDVEGISGAGEVRVVAAADNGRLFGMSDDGRIAERHVFLGRIVKLLPYAGGSDVWVVLDDGSVYKRKGMHLQGGSSE